MNILDELLDSLINDAPVRSILVAAHWTAVSSRACGLAATLIDHHPHGHTQVREAGYLLQKSARQLAEFARSDNLLEASIGVAAINSLLDLPVDGPVELNAFEELKALGSGKKVALVGHFPFIPKLRLFVNQLWVIEQQPAEGEFPSEAAEYLLPKADIVAITGSSLINHTLDHLLELCPTQAMVMLLGPSTPLSPVLFSHGVSFLSGSRVEDETTVYRMIGQGANFRQVEGVRLVSYRCPGWNNAAKPE